MAHELNNPLTGIMGYEHLILREEALSERNRSRLVSIEKLSQRMAEIVGNLKRFSHSGDSALLAPVDLNQVLLESKELFAQKLALSGVELDIDMGQGTPVIIPGNRNNLESVFHNLMSNSLDAFKTCKNYPRKINISLGPDSAPSSVCIRYADNAGGMSKEVLEHIFDAFFTTKSVGSGTGLGMAIVHQIVLGHKGRISVKSKLGEGSVFTLTLPAWVKGLKN